jgi:UDP-3-O-[3-hydroxymyristoyl] glucosamine N-acyltransferase
MRATLGDIAILVQGTLIGDKALMIETLSPIDNIVANSLVFAEGGDNLHIAQSSQATAILVDHNVKISNKPIIQVMNPFKAFMSLLTHFHPPKKTILGVHPTAVVAENVELGKEISIGPYVVIESGSKIGDGCVIKSHVHIGQKVIIESHTVLHPHVTIYDDCHIGANICIHAGTVIGSDGFGYRFEGKQHTKVPHVGSVFIHDQVEIGANTVVDRATIGSTVIGEGTKIDNLVQIAHSVKLGKHNILCAFTGIAGSSVSGDHVIFAANVGVSDHVKIDDGVILGARAGVPSKKHLRHGNIYLGNPARPKEKAIEQELATTRIPIMRKNLKALSERVHALEQRLDKPKEEQR